MRHLPARLLIGLIEIYRSYISPTRMPTCRFTPTCSEYAVTALREWGVLIGFGLSVIRLLKCAPWHPGGWDPVPPRGGSARGAGVRDDCAHPVTPNPQLVHDDITEGAR